MKKIWRCFAPTCVLNTVATRWTKMTSGRKSCSTASMTAMPRSSGWRLRWGQARVMAANSKIEWTEATWNPVTGCTPVSDGCTNCYAARRARRFEWQERYAGLVTGDGKWNGRVRYDERVLGEPLRWRKPRMVFVVSMGDLFHSAVPFEFIDKVWEVMALCPQHTFQVLTKRPRRMREYVNAVQCGDRPIGRRSDCVYAPVTAASGCAAQLENHDGRLPNVWLGTSIENQTVEARVDELLACPSAVRFVSAEPLLGPLVLRRRLMSYHDSGEDLDSDEERNKWGCPVSLSALDWVIVGGESGPKARPCNGVWVQSLRDQCVEAGVPFFFKGWGGVNKKRSGRLLDGRTWNEMPSSSRGCSGVG